MNLERFYGLLTALGILALVLGVASLTTRIPPPSQSRAAADNQAAVAAWEAREMRMSERLTSQPEDYGAQVELARCLLALGTERAWRLLPSSVRDATEPGSAEDARELQADFDGTHECLEANALASRVAVEAPDPSIRSRTWLVLAATAAREGNEAEHRRCLAEAGVVPPAVPAALRRTTVRRQPWGAPWPAGAANSLTQ